MSKTARGRFITLEGGEGAGKSTLQTALRQRLEARGLPVLLTREPGGTPRAEAIRSLVLNPPGGEPFSALAELCLMNAARSDHLEELIRPALDAGRWVICDRFSDSTRVYQGVSGEVPAETIREFERVVVGATLPDLTLILDLPLAVAAQRRTARSGKSDVFEQRGAEFHQAVREAFASIARAEPDRCRLVDASLPASDVAACAWQHMLGLIAAADAGT